MNKRQERFFVEQAARRLDVPWEIGNDRECPDFVITEGDLTFGLEVSELFTGPVRKGGSVRKTEEALHQKTIDRHRATYETKSSIPLSVKILGTVDDRVMDQLVQELLQHDFVSMKPGAHIEIELNSHFKAHVTSAFRSEWYLVDDRVGWVNTNPLPIIQERVAKKSENLDRYRRAAGCDVRLLLVEDPVNASGMLILMEDEACIDTCGFHAVYFFSYPESVTVFAAGTPDR